MISGGLEKWQALTLMIIGLDGSGKTSLAKRLKSIEEGYEYYTSTTFMNIEKIMLPSRNNPCIVYDMSGQGRYREWWNDFYSEVDGIFFMVDATDHERLSIVQEMLNLIPQDTLLKDVNMPILVIFNKMDWPNALSSKEILDFIEFNDIKLRNSHIKWGVEETIVINGQGVPNWIKFFEDNVRIVSAVDEYRENHKEEFFE